MIKNFQTEYLSMDLLRFTTAGSVDDGKSTLIGRLLYDSKAILTDQLEAMELASRRRGEDKMNLALVTDGLRAEREQGITIDVAYRYFATPKRKFIIADTPGHIQYTRNMATGASTANAALILIDAKNGVVEQTIRHAYIASLLCIPHIIVCVNKMDIVNYNKNAFEQICINFECLTTKLNIDNLNFIPLSALKGDNVVDLSKNMSWYQGPSLLYLLENINITNDCSLADARFPVQFIIKANSKELHNYRGYAGRIEGGSLNQGDLVTVLPSGLNTKIKSIDIFGSSYDKAFAPRSVTLTIEGDIDISRGDMIVKKDKLPQIGQDIELMICWLNEKPLLPGKTYYLKHTTNEARCIIKEIIYKVDIKTLAHNFVDKILKMNDIASIKIRTTKPLFYDSYKKNRNTGSLVLIDESTYETVCAAMIV